MSALPWLRRFWRAADRALLDVCYPEDAVCLVCGRASGGETLCARCTDLLEGELLQAGETECRAVWHYGGPAGALVRMLKENGVAAAAGPLADGMAELLPELGTQPDTVITWVPMPPLRRGERGIDHGEVLARAVAERAGLTVRPLLRRNVRDMKTQRGLSRGERLKNIRGKFEPLGGVPADCLIVDDVTTSGATMNECRETLLEAGAQRVSLLAACASVLDG